MYVKLEIAIEELKNSRLTNGRVCVDMCEYITEGEREGGDV